MALKKGAWSKIDVWLDTQPHEEAREFREFARKHYHHKQEVRDELARRGLEVGISTVYNWMSQNMVPGREAAAINLDSIDYNGIDAISLMEQIIAKLFKVTNLVIEKIEKEGLRNLEIGDAVHSLPLYTRDIKDYLKLLSLTTERTDCHTLIMEGASRITQIVLGSHQVAGTPEEAYMKKLLEAALLQVNEESQATFANRQG